VASLIELGAAIRLGGSESNAGGRSRVAILADVCEALIGAVFVDGGYDAAAALITRLWEERMRTPKRPLRDAKTHAAGMGAGARPSDAGLSRGRAHGTRPRPGISGHRRAAPIARRRKEPAAPSARPSRPPPPSC